MLIKVINWCGHRILPKANEPTFYLERDNWDDNYFKTRYHLHLSGSASPDGVPVWLGEVKILRKGQRKEDHALVEPGSIDFLDFRYCSIGQSLDYYEKIGRLDVDLRFEILHALRDIAIFPEIRAEFDREEGLALSLLHFLRTDDDFFALAPAFVHQRFDDLAWRDLAFRLQTRALEAPLEFVFESPEFGYSLSEETASRVWVITSHEGNEHGELLAIISRILMASNDDRELFEEEEFGWVDPLGVAFTKLICLCYTDSSPIRVPGIYLHEKEQIARDLVKGLGRFLFFGVQDLPLIMEKSLPLFVIDTDGRVWENDTVGKKDTSIKSESARCEEFVDALGIIEESVDQLELLGRVCSVLEMNSNFQGVTGIDFSSMNDRARAEYFSNLTYPNQCVFHAILNLIAHIIPRSLVLFHAPEVILQPPALVIFMNAIYAIIDSANAMMIVATQSPEIIQETRRDAVSVISRNGDYLRVSSLEIEK